MLEAQIIELSSKVETGSQTTHDLLKKFATQMASWKEEMLETIRLNRPPPPVIDPAGFSSVHERGQVPSNQTPPLGEGSFVPGRRQGKEPADDLAAMADLGGETSEEEFLGHQASLRRAQREWAPRRGNLEGGRNTNLGQNGDYFMRYKTEFPSFDYDNPRLWVNRCEKFFILSHIPRNETLNILYVNLSGRIGLWFESYLMV